MKLKKYAKERVESGRPPLTKTAERYTVRNTQTYCFRADYNDHFETPKQAYKDLDPCLALLCAAYIKKDKTDSIIYDPYYCQGRVVTYLHEFGYPNVINANRDFYKDIDKATVPLHDIMVTNPPYSGEHKIQLLQYLQSSVSNRRPFALLLPAYIATKQYWRTFCDQVQSSYKIAYLLPKQSYQYDHPEGTGKDIPPFYSAWLIGLPLAPPPSNSTEPSLFEMYES